MNAELFTFGSSTQSSPTFGPMKTVFFAFACSVLAMGVSAQPVFDLATGLSVLRNLSPQQEFWAVGQQVQGNVHFSPRNAAYASLEYYTDGSFRNPFTAPAKSILMTPQSVSFTATGKLAYRQVSLGLRHYFTGGASNKKIISIYGQAGLGFLFARITNSASPAFDTTYYYTPMIMGSGLVKRLTFDAGIGVEKHLSSAVFAFVNARSWLPASHQLSPYLHNNDRVPLAVMTGAGVRILFGNYY